MISDTVSLISGHRHTGLIFVGCMSYSREEVPWQKTDSKTKFRSNAAARYQTTSSVNYHLVLSRHTVRHSYSIHTIAALSFYKELCPAGRHLTRRRNLRAAFPCKRSGTYLALLPHDLRHELQRSAKAAGKQLCRLCNHLRRIHCDLHSHFRYNIKQLLENMTFKQ